MTVARVGEIAPGTGRQVTVGERWVGLFNIKGEYHAIDNLCLHRGGPLCEGPISGTVVTCPWHGWQYELTTGTLIQDPSSASPVTKPASSATTSRSVSPTSD